MDQEIKGEFDKVRTELRQEMGDMKNELRQEMADVKNELKTLIEEKIEWLGKMIKTGVLNEIEAIKADIAVLKTDMAEVKTDIITIKNSFVTKEYLDKKLANFAAANHLAVREENGPGYKAV